MSAFSLLSAIAVPVGEALPRLEGSEQLVSNLLEVTGFAPRHPLGVHALPGPRRRLGADAVERRVRERAFICPAGQIHTLASLEDGPLAVLCDGPVTSAPTGEWADSQDERPCRGGSWPC